MSNCPFCAIIDGTNTTPIVYQDGENIAFLDHAPYTRGHTLIVPRRHYRDLLAVPPEAIGGLFGLAQRVGQAALQALQADGFHLGINNGKAARQVVFHAHVHIIPRWHGDEMDFSSRLKLSRAEEEEVSQALRQALDVPGEYGYDETVTDTPA